MSDQWVAANTAAAILDAAPEPSPEKIRALRYLDRAVAEIHAAALARHAAAPAHAPTPPLPAGEPAPAPLATSRRLVEQAAD